MCGKIVMFCTYLVIFVCLEDIYVNIYYEIVVKSILVPSASATCERFVFVDDNTHPHRARIVNDRLVLL